MQNLTLADYFLLPFYLSIIYFVAYAIRNKFYPKRHPWHTYFIPGLTIKIIGAIFIGLIYEYYYNGGDTYNFFLHSKIINSSFTTSPGTWLRLITHSADERNITDMFYVSQMYWYDELSTYTVGCIGAFLGIFCFTKYLVIAVLLATISFTGTWSLFRTFAMQYPNRTKQVALATLFIPSTIIWGSALFKDTICMFAIGWLTYSFYMLFEKRQLNLKYFAIIVACIFFAGLVKAYILLAFLPILTFKTFLGFKNSFERKRARVIIFSLMLVIYSGLFIYAYNKTQTSQILLKYSMENIASTAKITGRYLLQQSESFQGSGYNLGDFDPTLKGMLKKFLPAVNVSLFRPYIWEAKKPIIIFAALESLAFMLLTLYVLLTTNPLQIIKKIFSDPNILFCLVFAVIFAFFTGISSYNFGTLSRYKIPCMPFYALFLVLLLKEKKCKKEPAAKFSSI